MLTLISLSLTLTIVVLTAAALACRACDDAAGIDE